MIGETFSEILCAQACNRSDSCMRRILLEYFLHLKEQGKILPPLAKMYMGDTKNCEYYLTNKEEEWDLI